MRATRLHAWIYDYLARVFDGDVDDLPAPPDLQGAPEWLSRAVERLRSSIAQSPRDAVLATHARLFVSAQGGVVAPPYASWYLDECLCGPASDCAKQAYAAQGLESAPDAGEPADYLGTELEFMYFLARHELAARSTGDDQALHAIIETQAAFVLPHLAHWLPPFFERIRAADPGPVFAAAVDLLDGALHEDTRRLSIGLSKPVAIAATR